MIIVHYLHVLMEITCRGGRNNMSVYESGINGEKTAGMMHRLVHYLNKLKELKFVIILGVRNTIPYNFLFRLIIINTYKDHFRIIRYMHAYLYVNTIKAS